MLIIVLTTQMNSRVVSISVIAPITSEEQMLLCECSVKHRLILLSCIVCGKRT